MLSSVQINNLQKIIEYEGIQRNKRAKSMIERIAEKREESMRIKLRQRLFEQSLVHPKKRKQL